MSEEQIRELVRVAYLAGISDKEEGCDQWCVQGSLERANEIIKEYIDETKTV